MGEYTALCKQNVANLPRESPNVPNVNCDWTTVCMPITRNLNKYCQDTGRTQGDPVPQINSNPPPTICYCCCSCFAYDTPIEVATGIFTQIQELQIGDTVLAAGTDLKWEETEVALATDLGPDLEFPHMFYVAYRFQDSEEGEIIRSMIVTADHLFLMGSGKLKPVQHLIPGNKLQQADGQVAEVAFCVNSSYKGGLHHIATGDFDNKTLDEHLINSNGIVSAGYNVQLAFTAGHIDPSFITDGPDGDALQVGTQQYTEQFQCEEAMAFLKDPSKYPGKVEKPDTRVFHVPDNAFGYLTSAQVESIIKSDPPHSAIGNVMEATTLNYLFKIYGAFYPDIIFLNGWNNEEPNAFAWENLGQKFVLVTGGMARLNDINRDGLSMIISHCVAYHEGIDWVGDADYYSVYMSLRQVWNNDLFAKVFTSGYSQLETLFGYIDVKSEPSTACRLETLKMASSMLPIPECAISPSNYFEVVQAIANNNLKNVLVMFDRELDKKAVTDVKNYEISPQVKILKAGIGGNYGQSVRLVTAGLDPNTTYTVKVNNLLSVGGLPLNPKHNSSEFSTP
ncbi:MAG: hypothetical protein HQL54_01580 [Magnetococcales bacterium]|nr:hypothetical protein [Magnetococcales bacterium]